MLLLGCVLAAMAASAAAASAAPVVESPGAGERTNGTPTFAGSAEDPMAPVEVEVYEGSSTAGKEVEQVEAHPSLEGSWSVTPSESLASGLYTVVAAQGEPPELSVSEPVTFDVVTSPPNVTLNQPATPSKVTQPTLSGKVSEPGEVVVHIYEGSQAGVDEVTQATTSTSGSTWSVGVSLAGGEHTYTAVATEAGSIGNGKGESEARTFVVDTEPPTVTLQQPATPSKERTPTLKGTASEDTSVTVRVYEGSEPFGSEVASATTKAAGGSWQAKVSLPPGDNTFTAVATEVSGLGNEAGTSEPRTFVVDTVGPTVSLTQPPTPTNNTDPTLSGATSEAGWVVGHVFEGTKASGKEVAEIGTYTGGGGWSTPVQLSGGDHTYTAVATEVSGLGNEEGRSEAKTFVIDTEPPSVSLNQPKTPSDITNPTLGGSASEETEVVVRVFEGTKAEGREVTSATTTAGSGEWSAQVSLPTTGEHTYTAIATERSGIAGNAAGHSEARTFFVSTVVPTVTLAQPSSPTKNPSPTLTGTASEAGEVVVRVFEGTKAEGKEVARTTTSTSGGGWSAQVGLATGDHTYTAIASEASSLGNGTGVSQAKTFVIDTNPPTVTLEQPATPSNVTTPTFSGSASEAGEVMVRVFEGTKAEGRVVDEFTTQTGAGSWSVQASLPTGDHTYTARAFEASALENGEGKSEPRTFVIDTNPPTVTLEQPATPSKTTNPTLGGSASENTQVVVRVYEGAEAKGTEVANATTTASGGSWSAQVVVPEGDHTYTAIATEASGLGNPSGQSAARSFVVDTLPPHVTLFEPTPRSSDYSPTFGGTASENTQVVVHVFEGTKAEGKEVAKGTTTAAGGSWQVGVTLPTGEHTFTAVATEKSGLGNAEGRSEAWTFLVNTNPPAVSLTAPAARSNDTTPAFTGEASEAGTVIVHIYEGSRAEGNQVATATASIGAAGGWSSGQASPALASGEHTYTAVATETSALGNGVGTSAAHTFVVDTNPPAVTLKGPTAPSNNTSPSFSGTASENTEVVVRIYEGSKAEGTEVAKASTTASGGSWSVGATVPSGTHTFTAVAIEKSGLGNAEGRSAEQTFFVNTNPPVVSLNQVLTPSKNTAPSLSGSASENTEVTVRVYEGAQAKGTEVTKATTTGKEGSWTASVKLPTGEHTFTAVATEKSGLGNAEGRSEERTFFVNTNPPAVSLTAPAARSNDTTPAFTGEASEAGTVVVHVYEGTKPEGKQVATATASIGAGGDWSSGQASPALASGEHTYTAVATETSALGNGEGTSTAHTFVVDTNPPTVTLKAPASPTNNTSPSFSGTASEDTEVVVRVYEGSKAEGTEVAKASTTASGGSWSVGATVPSGTHTFTAVAIETSGLGNAAGRSEEHTFIVNTNPPVVVLTAPPARSNNTTPSFSGSASENTEVTVRVYEGAEAKGTEVAHVSTTAKEGSWSTGTVKLAEGEHTYTAIAIEKSGLGNAEGKSTAQPFVIDTKPPTVTLTPPAPRSKNTAPTFSGSASEETEVTVRVYEGTEAKGTEVAHVSTTAKEGSWSTAAVKLAEGEHTYTAIAIEKSGLGNAEGKSTAQQFVIDTKPPTVTLTQPKTPSNTTAPSFSGTASESTEVIVQVYEGTKAEGTPVAKIATTAKEGAWTTAALKLFEGEQEHTYTAVATEVSGLGNEAGKSEAKTFFVNTKPPTVTLKAPSLESPEAKPEFRGTTTEAGLVTVEVFKGSTLSGTPVATLKDELSAAGEWHTLHVEPELANGEYTVRARQPSALKNPEGFSPAASFVVNKGVPNVVLNPVTSPSSDLTPSFSGTASDTTEVVVHVYEGAAAEGSRTVGEIHVTKIENKKWTATLAAPLPAGDHTYTAVAEQASHLLGNGTGKSAPVSFVVNTLAPTVTLTGPPSPSKNSSPSFRGTVSEDGNVIVHVYQGATAAGSPVAEATAKASGGNWVSNAVSLSEGEFTAVAEEPSPLAGNPTGESQSVTFVVDERPPDVTLHEVPSPSSNTSPSFAGTASDHTPVTVEVFSGGSATGTPVRSLTAEVAGGAWSTGRLSPALPWGEYTVLATEPSSIENGPGSATATFTLEQIAPAVTTEAGDAVNSSSGYLHGFVNPNHGNVETCFFEWGATTGYGGTAECALSSGEEDFPQNASTAIPVFARIFSLKGGTTYHFRLHVVNEGGGAALGGDQTFTTMPELGGILPSSPGPATGGGAGKGGVLGEIAAEILPAKGLTIPKLLKKGLYGLRFKAPEAGTASITWSYKPLAKAHAKKKPKAVVVASGKATFAAPGTKVITIRVTPAGRKLLRSMGRLKVTVSCVFTPAGSAAVRTSASFQLAR